MKRRKLYLQPADMLINALHDLAGLQKAETVMSDVIHGLMRLKIAIYDEEIEYAFFIDDVGGRRCCVNIEIPGEDKKTERLLCHEFALLDYVLVDVSRIEVVETEEWDRQIAAESAASE